jgi:hypothetical protein
MVHDRDGARRAAFALDSDRNLFEASEDLLVACEIAVWELRGGRGVPVNTDRVADDLDEAMKQVRGAIDCTKRKEEDDGL